jgi:type I restriction enzyme S subunit
LCRNHVASKNRGTNQRKITAIPNLTLEIIADCIIPIAPINQQNKIVKKLDHLFSLI